MKTKNVLCFFALFLYVMGTIGGIGYCIYSHAWIFAIAVAVVAAMAIPTVVSFYKFLTD